MKKEKCIICREENVEMSDEHVFPEAIKGHYHVYNVCKVCNSKMGEYIDPLLTNHFLIEGYRFSHKMKGKKGDLPNPFRGIGKIEDGRKCRLDLKDGHLVPYILPEFSEVNTENGNISFSIDASQEKEIDKIVEKIVKRNFPNRKPQLNKSERVIRQIENPVITISQEVDISNFKMALLKIAYEFTIDNIPNYIHDAEAVKISNVLHSCDCKRLDEITFYGNGLYIEGNDVVDDILGDYIDCKKETRHITLLMSFRQSTICFVRIANIFCVGIRMSEQIYKEADPFIIGINDCDGTYKTYNLLSLMKDKLLMVNNESARRWYMEEDSTTMENNC
jgi:hypothetical protein